MLRFALDNNALQALVNHDSYSEYKARIVRSVTKSEMCVYFTHIGFLELGTGLNADNFEERRCIINECLSLCKGNILALPQLYVYMDIGLRSKEQLSDEESGLHDYFTKVSSVESFEELPDAVVRQMDGFKQHMIDLHIKRVDVQYKARQLEHKDGGDGPADFVEGFKQSLIRKLKQTRDLPTDDIERFKKHPGVECFANYWYGYNKKTQSSGFTSKRGDSADAMLVMYLDRCDYLISNDRVLKDIADGQGSDKLHGRVIDVSRFLDHICIPTLPSRSMIDGYDVYYR